MKIKEMRRGCVCRVIQYKRPCVVNGPDNDIIFLELKNNNIIGLFYDCFVTVENNSITKDSNYKERLRAWDLRKVHSVRPHIVEEPYEVTSEFDLVVKLRSDRPHSLFPWVDLVSYTELQELQELQGK